MKKIKYLLLLVCIAGCFTACRKADDSAIAAATASQKAQLTTDTVAIRQFIVTNNIPALKDKSGVFYQIILPGTGSTTYTANTYIGGTYTGKLLNGGVFDSGTLAPTQLSGLILGWQIGIPYIQNGGQIRLIIPSIYGYGSSAVGTIPANSILDFTISLTSVQ